jgi:hypothetical protein
MTSIFQTNLMTTLTLRLMEDDLNFKENGRQPQFFKQIWWTTLTLRLMEDDLNFKENGRRPQFQRKWNTTSICSQIKHDLNLLVIGSRPQRL